MYCCRVFALLLLFLNGIAAADLLMICRVVTLPLLF